MLRNHWTNVLGFVGLFFAGTLGLYGQENRVELAAFTFQAAPPRSGTGMRLEQSGPNALQMAMTAAAEFGSEWIFADFQHESTAQQKLMFRVKGNPANGEAFFHPILVLQDGKRKRTVVGPSIATNGGDFRRYVMGLDTDFQLGDGRYTVVGLQFSFNSHRVPLGTELSVTLDHIRLADNDDAAVRKRLPIVVCRRDKAAPPPMTPTLAVYFSMDNNDRCTSVSRNASKKTETPDFHGDFSYRELLLEHAPFFRVVETPEEADVLVYQRTTPTDEAAKLAELVRAGKPLVLYGEIPDVELAKCSPMEEIQLRVKPGEPQTFPPREKLTQTGETWPIQEISFPRYFDVKLAPGAEAVLRFAESGVPYLARKGNVCHIAGTSGTTLIPSRIYYDKFALMLWAEQAGKPEIVEKLERWERSRRPPQAVKKEGLSWYATPGGFGRFGWRVEEPGLVDVVSSDLTLTNGDQRYRFDPPTAATEKLRMFVSCTDVQKQFLLQYPDATVDFTMTLLSPYARWMFTSSDDSVFMTLENIADYAAWQTPHGVKVVSLKDLPASEVLFDLSRDGKWAAPWLFLYREKEAKPLLLVFPHQPKKIASQVHYGLLEGLEITFDTSGNRSATLMAGWPWGVAKHDFPGWGKQLPQEALARIQQGVHQALYFLLDRTEFFALDPAQGRIRFRTEGRFLHLADDWNTEKKPYLCLPPLTAFLLREGVMVETSEKLEDFDLPTPFGPMLGKAGETVEWSLPLPGLDDLIPVKIRDEKINALQNKLFLDGVQWTCGGHVPLEHLSPAHPMGPDCKEPNISHFTWNFGMCTALQGSLLLNDEAQRKLENRIVLRTLAPMERYQYKAFTRHRCEPFSGCRYPVMFNSFYPNDTPYEPGFGSSVQYGDTNEATVVVVWTGQQLADRFGMSDLIRANWNFYRYVMRHQRFIDDSITQAGSCRESGAGAWIDMLNAEYSGMLAYARLAQIAGDELEYAEAMARAAKKAVPTVARLYFNSWWERLHPEWIGKKYLVTGFAESGAKVMTFPTQSGNFLAANDLFDYSQGIPGTQYYLYRKYAWQPIQKYLSEIAYPELLALHAKPRYDYLAALGLYFDDLDKVRAYANTVFAEPENHKAEDWPGIRCPQQIASVLWREHHQIAITRAENLKLDAAEYDPKTQTLYLRGTAGENARLEVSHRVFPVKGAFEMTIPWKRDECFIDN
ncbi:MAG: hypothetical protein Q4D98_08835 [Planctomycetia bacterium]|nr:hypothetical protein [Planctomycetia bacterium]